MITAMCRGIRSAGTSVNCGRWGSGGAPVALVVSLAVEREMVGASGIVDMAGEDGLLAIGPHGDDLHRLAHQGVKPIEIIAGPPGQVGNAADVADLRLPARHRFVDRDQRRRSSTWSGKFTIRCPSSS